MTASGQMQLPLKIDDTVLRKTASAGDATGTVKYDCTAINGVRDNDWQNAKNNVCADFNARSFYVQMAEQVQAQAQTQAAAAIRNVATSYLQLAKNATDQDVGLENYILFALMSSDTSGQDYQQALASIHARDAELSPQTAFR